MVTFTLPDAAERDLIRTEVGVNMCVEAGAGTGKTTVLVDRIVNILASGHADVHHLAVITFTEKAAAELAGRVRKGLEDALDAALEATGAGADPLRRARIEEALRGLNHAHIETIHAFASSLLRERPVEAALDPGFEVLSDLPAQLAFESAYSEWLAAEMAADVPPAALLDAMNVGLEFRLVREAAEQLHRHREMRPLGAYDERDVDIEAVVAEFGELVAEMRTYERYAKIETDNALGEIAKLAAAQADLAALGGRPDAMRRTLAQQDKVNVRAGARPNWAPQEKCTELKSVFIRASALVDGARTDMRAGATARLLAWLEGFVDGYDLRRKDAGKADFDDLLLWARDLVRNDEVRAYFQDRYRCILVDEFQDTDPLQVEIIVSLCAEGALPADWRRATLRPGSLFVVGDPKQSIYRFRGADIAMYDDVKAHIFGDAPVRITQNFRSARPVIDWVNDVFETLLQRREGVQPQQVPLEYHPDYAAQGGVAVLAGVAPPGEDGKNGITPLRKFEAERLAALIGDAVERGAWSVRDAAAGGVRAATYRDVVVIIPSRTELEHYEDAFARAGVPCRHEGGRTFFQRQEVRELVAVLRAIDDPGDGVAAIAALRSSAFGCSDEELLLHRSAKLGFDYASLRFDAEGPVADAMRVLARLSLLRHAKPLPELLRAVLDETRLVEFAMLQPQGEQVAANLLKMIDQARTFADASGRGLRGFVRWLKENIARTADETDAPISEETDDVVRILTVHASKGLEFPIVVFANMNGPRVDRTRVIRDRTAGRLHVKLGKKEELFRTPGYDDADDIEKEHSLAEEARLLYVAATRAKDHLVLPFFTSGEDKGAPKEAKSLNDLLRTTGAHLAPTHDLSQLPPVIGELPIWRRDPAAADDGAIALVTDERDAWATGHRDLVAAASVALVVRTASALKPEWERPAAADDGVRRGKAADFGSAVHALLERIELRRAGDIGRLASVVAEEHGQQGREAEIATLARRALQSETVKRALRSPRMLLEAPFIAALPLDEAMRSGLPEGLAEGRIDLLFEEGGELVIADFKTDAVSKAEVDSRAQFYRNQALVYAWAAHAATGMPVREVIFLFVRPGIDHTTPVDAAFMAEAEALMRSVPEPELEAEAV